MASVEVMTPSDGHYKDAILAELSQRGNIAQFVSFDAHTCAVRFICVSNPPREAPVTVEECAAMLLARSSEQSVNVRAFDPHQPKSNEFIYGLRDSDEVSAHVRRLALAGLYTIINETVDVGDGGVSGVSYGGIIEFSPDDTPRAVEKPGVASLPRPVAMRLLSTVYGFEPDLPYPDSVRTEFSIHPSPRGITHGHTLIWELEETDPVVLQPGMAWPNNFSRLIGDKAFGLLVADSIGLAVPRTTVIGRRVAPFMFGASTGVSENWIRTAPREPVPGRYTTRKGWVDPFALLAEEDPQGAVLASVLAQEGVKADYSGAAAGSARSDSSVVEGVRGAGDEFMLGERSPEPLPAEVTRDVRRALHVASRWLGAARIEWVHDGQAVWIVQLHRGEFVSRGDVIFPGRAEHEHEYAVAQGLDGLRQLIEGIRGTGDGVVLVGSVGITSHFGDVLRKARIPSRIVGTSYRQP
jgi:hypothetical protein